MMARYSTSLKVFKIFIIWTLGFAFSFFSYGGDFTMVRGGKNVTIGVFSNQREFVELLKKHLATPQQVEQEMKEVYGLMFFIMPAPRQSLQSSQTAKILDFYNYPERFGFHADAFTKLYSTKDDAVFSDEMKRKTEEYGVSKLFVIGVDIKTGKMHSISKPNGVRIYLNPWYRD
ncbi:MAG: hypothetical protein ACM3SY_02895 [Candidatus Omnitrophota bacterium]